MAGLTRPSRTSSSEFAARLDRRVKPANGEFYLVLRAANAVLGMPTSNAFALANTPLPRGLASQPMGKDRLALVMRRGHPAAGSRCTLKQYAKLGHVGVRIFGDGVSEIDRQLAAAGLKREMKLMTPHFMAALTTVSQSDLVTTISRAFAEKFAPSLNLVVLDAPLPDVDLKQTVVYPQIRKDDRFVMWMITALQEVALTVYGG